MQCRGTTRQVKDCGLRRIHPTWVVPVDDAAHATILARNPCAAGSQSDLRRKLRDPLCGDAEKNVRVMCSPMRRWNERRAALVARRDSVTKPVSGAGPRQGGRGIAGFMKRCRSPRESPGFAASRSRATPKRSAKGLSLIRATASACEHARDADHRPKLRRVSPPWRGRHRQACGPCTGSRTFTAELRGSSSARARGTRRRPPAARVRRAGATMGTECVDYPVERARTDCEAEAFDESRT